MMLQAGRSSPFFHQRKAPKAQPTFEAQPTWSLKRKARQDPSPGRRWAAGVEALRSTAVDLVDWEGRQIRNRGGDAGGGGAAGGGPEAGAGLGRRDSAASLYSSGVLRAESRPAVRQKVDPYYQGEFGFGRYPLVFDPVVLGCVSRTNPVRRVCIALVRTTGFESVILVLIFVNALLMALWDPVADLLGSPSSLNDWIQQLEWLFLPAFTLEAVVKIVALGAFVRPSGYFRDMWNWLDFTIVVLGIVPLLVLALSDSNDNDNNTSSLTVVRSVRILRPLRALSFFPALKNLVQTLLGAARSIGAVLFLCVAILLIFALVGLTLFQGKLRQRCGVVFDDGSWAIPQDELELHCSLFPEAFGRACPSGLECVVTDFNPNEGLVSFDNIGSSLLTIFQTITEEGWSGTMFALFDTTYRFIGVYFILLVLFGSYFMVNLIISALSVNYREVRRRNERKRGLDRERDSFMQTLVQQAESKHERLERFLQLESKDQVSCVEMRLMYSYEQHHNDPGYSVVTEEMYDSYMAKHRARYPRFKEKLKRRLEMRRHQQSVSTYRLQNLNGFQDLPSAALALQSASNDGSNKSLMDAPSRKDSVASGDFQEAFQSMHEIPSSSPPASNNPPATLSRELSDLTAFHDSMDAIEDGSHSPADQVLQGNTTPIGGSPNDHVLAIEAFGKDSAVKASVPPPLRRVESDAGSSRASTSKASAGSLWRRRRRSPKHKHVPHGAREDASRWRKRVYRALIDPSSPGAKWFNRAVILTIFLNTFALATEHFEQPDWLFELQEKSNIVFLAFFSLEIAINLFAQGFRCYFASLFNRFDAFIVLMGYVELAFSGNVASVFRLLRILRILRAAKYWPTFKDLLVSVDATVKQLLPFLVFFSLFLYIFTISGLHLLGGRMTISRVVVEEAYQFPDEPDVATSQAFLALGSNVTVETNPEFDCTEQAGNFRITLDDGTTVWHCPVRANYDNFLWSLITSFQVITGEDWNSVMYTAVEQVHQYWPVVYFVLLEIFGTYVVLNFFMAILIDTFVEQHMERAKAKKEAKMMRTLERASRRRKRKKRKNTPERQITLQVDRNDEEDSHSGSTELRDSANRSASVVFQELTTLGTSVNGDDQAPAVPGYGGGKDDDEDDDYDDDEDDDDNEDEKEVRDSSRVSKSRSFATGVRKTANSIQSQAKSFRLPAMSDATTLHRSSTLRDVIERKKNEKLYNLNEQEVLELEAFRSNSLGVLKPTSPVRIKAAILVHKWWFDMFVLLVILLSCVLLALDSPGNDLDADVVYGLNVVITVVFAVEAMLKIISFGFIRNPGAYLRNAWNVLDFFILVISIVDVSFPEADTNGLKVMRALRALRPLRTINRFEGLRIVVQSFAMAIVPCFQVLGLCLVFYAMFSICSTTFFLGELFACYSCEVSTDPNAGPLVCFRNYSEAAPNCFPYPDTPQYNFGLEDCPELRRCEGTSADGTIQYMWHNPTYGSINELELTSHEYSFDSFLTSFSVLFEISTMEIWTEPMYMVSDITGIGRDPIRGSSDASALFFPVFLFTLQFFMLQVFVAVLIDTYFDSASAEHGDAFMSPEQRKWVEYNRRAFTRPFKPHTAINRPSGGLRRWCYDVAVHPWLKPFVNATIVINTILLMSDHFDASQTYKDAFQILDVIFGCIYIIEAAVKMIGHGPRSYFSHRSNCFDFFIVVAVLLGWGFQIAMSASNTDSGAVEASEAVLQAIEALRVLRIFRLLKSFPMLKPLLSTLILTLYPLLNILSLIFLALFTYAVVGMQLFGELTEQESPGREMTFITEHVNFHTFSNAFYTLFVIGTGESWNGIMHDLTFFSRHAVWFCVSFVVLMTLFLLNLFVAVILAHFTAEFENTPRKDGVKEHVDENALKHFNNQWNVVHLCYLNEIKSDIVEARRRGDYDAKARLELELVNAKQKPCFLPAVKFVDLMLRLKAPLGFRKRSSRATFKVVHVMRYVKDKHIPVTTDGMIHFHATLRALIDINVLQGEVPDDVEQFLHLKLSSFTRDVSFSPPQDVETSMDLILAREQIKALIRNYAILWRVRRLRRSGATKQQIRAALEEHERHVLQLQHKEDEILNQVEASSSPVAGLSPPQLPARLIHKIPSLRSFSGSRQNSGESP